MAYNPNDAVLLKHLLELATRIKNQGYQTADDVNDLINAAIATVYKPAGRKAAADLTAALLVAANEGKVYDLSTALTIDAGNKDLFVEGIEASYPIGTNVVVINVGTAETPSFKFDVLPGFIDLSNYVTKIASPVADELLSMNANGEPVGSGIAKGDVQKKLADTTFTEDNIRVTDANGFAKDGGVSKNDIQQKLTGATSGNLLKVGANGFMEDSGSGIATDAAVNEALETVYPTNASGN